MELDPAHLSRADRYKLLIGGIVPRPIAFVSTISVDGIANLAPFSFFNGVGSDPMTLLFCPANDGDGGEKDTLRNAKPRAEGGQGEFVVNAAVEAYLEQVVQASATLPPEESEFELTGLSPVPGRVVAPPRVGESPLAYECRTLQVIRTNPGKPGGGNVVLGEVLHVHVRDDLIDERHRIDAEALRAVGRMGGADYARTRDRLRVDRPR